MKLFKFKGGVHPPDYKALSKDSPIETLPVPKKVRVPLAQHLGVPADPVVKKGDTVAAGQLIGEARGFISAVIHAPISGTVTAVGPVACSAGGTAPGVEITSDGEDTWSPELKPVEEVTGEAVIQAVQRAGIVGMGGAAFPSHVKLQPPVEKKISLLILNAAECEPFLTCDYRLMLEDGATIIRGAELLMLALGIERCVIGIENNKPDAAEKMRNLVEDRGNITVQPLRTRYPQGGEKQLIYALTGREVPSGGLPMDVGCVVHNVGTAAAVASAVDEGKPLVERVLTVSGDAVARPSNFRVRLGSSIGDVLEAAGYDEKQCAKIVMGGPMTGMAQTDLTVPVVKGTSGVLAFTKRWVSDEEAGPCIRCGRCVSTCPVGLEPTMLEALAMREDVTGLIEGHAMDCIECGICSYACPARRSLVHAIKYGKAQIMALRKAKKKK